MHSAGLKLDRKGELMVGITYEQKEEKQIYESELNFLFEFELSERGKVEQIERELDVIQFYIGLLNSLEKKSYDTFDYLIVMPIRKLLCEEKSILREVCPDFKMPKFDGEVHVFDDENLQSKLRIKVTHFVVDPQKEWISLDDWLQSKIAWLDKTSDDVPIGFDEHIYQTIRNKVNKLNKIQKGIISEFDSFFRLEEMEMRDGNKCKVYRFVDREDEQKKERLFCILKQTGYYDLTLYDFLKGIADGRGAHIDKSMSPILKLVNITPYKGMSAIMVLAVQTMYAIAKQVKGLEKYLPQDFPQMEKEK